MTLVRAPGGRQCERRHRSRWGQSARSRRRFDPHGPDGAQQSVSDRFSVGMMTLRCGCSCAHRGLLGGVESALIAEVGGDGVVPRGRPSGAVPSHTHRRRWCSRRCRTPPSRRRCRGLSGPRTLDELDEVDERALRLGRRRHQCREPVAAGSGQLHKRQRSRREPLRAKSQEASSYT